MTDEAATQLPLEIVKRGETSLTLSLIRSGGGLTVSVKAHPAVETFMRGLGNGEHVDVKAGGPYWRSPGKEGPPLYVYALTEAIQPLTTDFGMVGIVRAGHPLVEPQGAMGLDGRVKIGINLSFLRLVGISEGAGITFVVRGVHTLESCGKMREYLGEAYKQFYRTYMKPVKMDIIVSTQETYL